MKKSNVLLITILSIIVTLMIGYALFSETITVTGTATAKGSFDIEVTCTKGVPSNLQDALNAAFNLDGTFSYDNGYPKIEGGYSNDKCTVNGTTITYSADLNYPGALRYFIVKTKNIGTISAKLNTDQYLAGGELIKNKTCIYNKSDGSLSNCNSDNFLYINALSGFKYIIAKESATGELYTFENDGLWNHLDDSGIYFIVEPNESLYFIYGVSWNEKWTDQTKYLTYEGIYELPFVQYVN